MYSHIWNSSESILRNYIPSILTDAGKKDWEIKPILRNASQLLAYM